MCFKSVKNSGLALSLLPSTFSFIYCFVFHHNLRTHRLWKRQKYWLLQSHLTGVNIVCTFYNRYSRQKRGVNRWWLVRFLSSVRRLSDRWCPVKVKFFRVSQSGCKSAQCLQQSAWTLTNRRMRQVKALDHPKRHGAFFMKLQAVMILLVATLPL